MRETTLGIGSNMPYRGMMSADIVRAACRELGSLFVSFAASSLYRTQALYIADQSDFYNMVVQGAVREGLTPYDLLAEIHKIETKYGRNRKKEIRFGPRSLDIDIELFGDMEIDDETLTIPHPRMRERAFVLVPLMEILKSGAGDRGSGADESRNNANALLIKKYAEDLEKLSDQRIERIADADFFSHGKRVAL